MVLPCDAPLVAGTIVLQRRELNPEVKASGGNSGTQNFYILFFFFNASGHSRERTHACCLFLVFCIGSADGIYIYTRASVRVSCHLLHRVSAALAGLAGWPRPLLLGRLQRGESQVCECINAPSSHHLVGFGQYIKERSPSP